MVHSGAEYTLNSTRKMNIIDKKIFYILILSSFISAQVDDIELPMEFNETTFNASVPKPIDVFNYGKHVRDFTYIDDIVKGIFLCSKKKLVKSKKNHLFKIVNIASGKPIKLINFISIII